MFSSKRPVSISDKYAWDDEHDQKLWALQEKLLAEKELIKQLEALTIQVSTAIHVMQTMRRHIPSRNSFLICQGEFRTTIICF